MAYSPIDDVLNEYRENGCPKEDDKYFLRLARLGFSDALATCLLDDVEQAVLNGAQERQCRNVIQIQKDLNCSNNY